MCVCDLQEQQDASDQGTQRYACLQWPLHPCVELTLCVQCWQILRCFPHCCPEHRDRSYCGRPLHVRVHAPALESSVVSNANDNSSKQSLGQVVVYGRFEREGPDRKSDSVEQLQLGQQVPIASITKRKEGDLWIQAQPDIAVGKKQVSMTIESRLAI